LETFQIHHYRHRWQHQALPICRDRHRKH
jgi:hypothetical protein